MILSQNVNKYLTQINRINKQQDFRLSDINNYIVDRVVIVRDRVVAYGIVKKMAEAIILLDQDASRFSRAKAMKELMEVAETGSKLVGCQQLHLFVKDVNLASSLERHFGFEQSQDIVLVKEL